MSDSNFIQKKLDSVFRDHPKNSFLILDNQVQFTYGDFFNQLQSIKDQFKSLGISSRTPVLVHLPRGKQETIFVSAMLYLGIPTMVIAESAKQSEVQRLLSKYPFRYLISSSKLFNSALGTAVEFAMPPENDQVIFVANPAFIQSEIQFNWLLNTSGSTGESKAVMLSAQNLEDRTLGEIQLFQIQNKSRLLNFLPLSHDLGLNQLLTTLYTGSSLEVFNKKLPMQLAERMQSHTMDGITGIPELWMNFIEIATRLNIRLDYSGYLTISGGTLVGDQISKLRLICPLAKIYKTYGQTETFRTFAEIDQNRISENNCGTWIDFVSGYLVNENHEHCAVGETGELIHFGRGVMTGYWLDTENTEKKMIQRQSPTNSEVLEIGIKTGDYFKLHPDSRFQFMGRADDVVKVSGHRFHLGEVENCILKLKQILKVVAIKIEDEKSVHMKEKIIAFVVFKNAEHLTAREIIYFCKSELEKYKVPHEIIICTEFPLTASVKVDRQKLVQQYLEKK